MAGTEINEMFHLRYLLHILGAFEDRRGQDLIEYALLAGLFAVGAGLFMPDITEHLRTIFEHVRMLLRCAAGSRRGGDLFQEVCLGEG